MNARGLVALVWLPLVAVAPGGCIASNVVAPEQRMVASDPAQLPWVPAAAADVAGFHESIDIQGDAAVALRRIWYVFDGGGTYSGAALAESDGQLAFQTLAGTWSLGADGLVLDGAVPVRCEQAAGHLRFTAPNGVVVLRRGAP